MSSDSEIERQAFAARLRTVRKLTRKTLRELQASTFASDSALSRYLAGGALAPWRVVEALCAETGTDPEELRAEWIAAGGGREERFLADDVRAIKAQIDAAVRQARERGEQIPATILTIQRLSTQAMRQLGRSAGQGIA